MRTAFQIAALLAGVLVTPSGWAQTSSGQGSAGAPPAATGRQEQSAAMSGTAGHRGSEVATKQEFVRLAASNAMFEVEAAKLAQERTRDEREGRIAQEMLNAHGNATEELCGLLLNISSLHGVQMPGQMAEQYQTWLSQLRAAQGDNFQALYAQQQAEAHLIAIDLFRNYSQVGDDEALKRWAASQLPVLGDEMDRCGTKDMWRVFSEPVR